MNMTPEEHREVFRDGWNAAIDEAAKACELEVERDAERGGRFGGYGPFKGPRTGAECAAAVRALREAAP